MKASRAMLPLAGAATIFYVARALASDSALFTTVVSAKRAEWAGCLLKLLCLVLGGLSGVRAARQLEADNPSRRAWLGLGLGLAAFAVGQAALSYYQLVLGRSPPLPSVGDAPFLIGYALMIAATVEFVRVYVASGFPVGSPRSLATLAVVGALAFVAIGVPLLRPIATAAAPLAEGALNVAYPVLDFVALVPALVLVRVTIAFRGGGVWRVWAALLAGWIFMAMGDVLFAYLSSAEHPKLASFVDLTLLLGYLFAALGTMLEVELLEAPVAAARAAAANVSNRIA